ncbi:fimbrial protein [Pseudomonas edaphica]|uniref:fimbrial protein n=1 Tax=Pseudomonas edaphica TaxID=2006980 RepID=UPI003D0D2FE6
MRYALICFLLCLIGARSACAVDYSPQTLSIALPSTINVTGNSLKGDVLWTSKKFVTNVSSNAGSGGWSAPVYSMVSNGVQASLPGCVFETNISGIGVKWWFETTGEGLISKAINVCTFTQTDQTTFVDGKVYPRKFWIELVRTGAIKAGVLNVGSNLSSYSHIQILKDVSVSVVSSTSIRIGPTCLVSTPVIPVRFGINSASSFRRLGDTSSPVSFSIGLSCSGGDAGISVASYVTLTDASKSTNISDVLSLSASSTASGLGIQILNGDTVLKYGPSSSMGSAQQWKAGDIRPGISAFQIPLRARYIQMGEKVTPGSANGQATFTLTYQ